jgi:trypsin-like peptidase
MFASILAVLALSVALVGQTECNGVNFEPGSMNETSLSNEFKNAIVRLQVPGSSDSGTGYLIDSENGFILTAFHVIQGVPAGSSIDVTTPSSRPNGAKLTASLVKSLAVAQQDGTVSGTDLALLKLDNPSLAKDIRPVDITLRFPSTSAVLYAMGYLKYDDEPNDKVREQPAQVMTALDDGGIEVRQTVYGGNSGGPLIDPSGSVTGTCRESVGYGATTARYIPMSAAESLLDLLPLSARMSDLDQRVRSGKISLSDLKGSLIKSSTTPTNVELYEWARHIMATRDEYLSSSTRDLLQCPMEAFAQRGLEKLVIALSIFGSRKTVGDAHLSLAEQEIDRGHPLVAEQHIQAATAAYGVANNIVDNTRVALLSARAQLALRSIAAASVLRLATSFGPLVEVNSGPSVEAY